MTCKQLQENLVDYLDGVLTGDVLAVAETHLSGCEQCREEVQELKQTLAWIKQAEDVTPPVNLRRDVLFQLKQEARKRPHRFPSWLAHATAAAAVFIMLVAGNVALPSTMKLTSEAPPSVMQEETLMLSSPANDTEAPENQPDFRAVESDSKANYDVPLSETDGAHSSTASGTTSALADSIEEPAKPSPIVRILFNMVSVPLFLLLAWLALRKKREAISHE